MSASVFNSYLKTLGQVNISLDIDELAAIGKSGLQRKPIDVSGKISPQTIVEVSQIMADANKQHLAVYPVSTGKNWGYGASSPVEQGCVLLDLSNLNEISELDEGIGLVKIQSGVTQGELCRYLENTSLMMDVTGAGPDTSIIGNILERGFGHTPLGNRSQYFVIGEAVLANGSIVNFSEGNQGVGRYGAAAGLHELMLQSNLLIVISMYIQLRKRPQSCLRCIVELTDNSRLSAYINIMQQLKQEGVFEGLPHIGNSLRAKSMFGSLKDKDKNSFGWTLATGIYGSKGVAKAKAKRAKQLLKPLGKITVISEKNFLRAFRLINFAAKFGRVGSIDFKQIAERFSTYKELLSLIDGKPTDIALKGCYWKSNKQFVKHADPVQDNCGFRWVAPVLPMRGDEVVRCLELADEEYTRAGFEMAVTLTIVTPQMCQAILSIYFDTSDEFEWQRANHLAKTLKQNFAKNGWAPYRVAIDEMQDIGDYTSQSIMDIRRSVKKAFDPENIIAPGRYAW